MKILAILYDHSEKEVFTTPLSSTLHVVGDNMKRGSSKRLVVFCKKCSSSGNGYFFSQRAKLKAGSIPCRCSPKYRKSKSEWLAFYRDFAKSCSADLVSFSGKELRLTCKYHGGFSIVYNGQIKTCPSCRKLVAEDLRPPAHPSNHDFIAGYSEDVNTGGNRVIKYSCPVCSADSFRQEGLCTGIFKMSSGDWRRGAISCRCSRSYRHSSGMVIFRARGELEKRGSCLTLKGANGNILNLSCPHHGDFNQDLYKFLGGTGCPSCAGKTSNFCYLNLVKDGNIPVAIKFGISVNPARRLRQQNRRNRFKMENICVFRFPAPRHCRSAEDGCKNALLCGKVSSFDMMDGHTETTDLRNANTVVEIFRKFGGTLGYD